MKKFNFTLQSVLNLKENIEETEKMLLSFLQSKWETLHSELENLNRIYEKSYRERKLYSSKGIDSAKLAEYSRFMNEIDRQRSLKQVQIYEVHNRINKQTQVLRQIRSEIKILEKLKEKQKKKHFTGIAKETDILVEDFIAGRLSIKML